MNPPNRDLRERVYRRDESICRYCGKQVKYTRRWSIWQRMIDHVIPWCQGGRNHVANLVTACASCNMLKAGRTPEQAGMPLLPRGTLRIPLPSHP